MDCNKTWEDGEIFRWQVSITNGCGNSNLKNYRPLTEVCFLLHFVIYFGWWTSFTWNLVGGRKQTARRHFLDGTRNNKQSAGTAGWQNEAHMMMYCYGDKWNKV